MRPLVKALLVVFALALVLAFGAGGCGKQIGDSCIVSSDCSNDGSRICIDSDQNDGYCTIQGCDYNTCPQESSCIRFFTGSFENEMCADSTECTLDELCTLPGFCAPRSAEIRYCMVRCDTTSDCRDGYECRTYDLMIEHGGEPVLAPGKTIDPAHVIKFCAVKPKPPM